MGRKEVIETSSEFKDLIAPTLSIIQAKPSNLHLPFRLQDPTTLLLSEMCSGNGTFDSEYLK